MKTFWMTCAAAVALSACSASDDGAVVDDDMDIATMDDADDMAMSSDETRRTTLETEMMDADMDMDVDMGANMDEAALRPSPVQNARYKELAEDGFCVAAGPQTPRDISFRDGTNPDMFMMAPPASEMNLCNIHTHTNAENKGPGFSISAGDGDNGGYQCNGTTDLTEAELADYPDMDYGKVAPGDTIEVHWVHTTCDVQPGEGLGSCLSDSCVDPLLRVETQVFLVVNDRDAVDFMDFTEVERDNGMFQPAAIPTGSGTPVQFRGSTTGTSYDAKGVCSPLRVTWSVRPQCQKLDIASLDAWAESGNVFNEVESHGIRPLVTDPRLLSPIN